MKDKISIIVPCFNEEACIDEFYRKTQQVAEEMRMKEGADYELLFVDDGSCDGTLDCLRKISQADSRCRFISFSRNFGKEAAMYAGLNEAAGNFAVFMDADLQHPPALLPKMYAAVKNGEYDCCGGKRKGREGDGKLRAFLSRGFYKICEALTGLNTNDGEGDFRMMNRQVMDAILSLHERGRYTKGIFSFVGFRTTQMTQKRAALCRSQKVARRLQAAKTTGRLKFNQIKRISHISAVSQHAFQMLSFGIATIMLH